MIQKIGKEIQSHPIQKNMVMSLLRHSINPLELAESCARLKDGVFSLGAAFNCAFPILYSPFPISHFSIAYPKEYTQFSR